MRAEGSDRDAAAMKKRALAAILWFLAGWYGGALIAMFTGASPYLGPILGTVAAALVAGDPFGWIWVRPRKAASPEPDSAPPPVSSLTSTERVQTTP
jgi:hypothetical protein